MYSLIVHHQNLIPKLYVNGVCEYTLGKLLELSEIVMGNSAQKTKATFVLVSHERRIPKQTSAMSDLLVQKSCSVTAGRATRKIFILVRVELSKHNFGIRKKK